MRYPLRSLAAALFIVLIAPPAVFADDLLSKTLPALDLHAGLFKDLVRESPPQQPSLVDTTRIARKLERPAAFAPLSAGYITLNGLDWATTVRALDNGHREGNPFMTSVASSPTALLLVKAGSTAATVYLINRLSKRHPRAATGVMVALNAVMAAVVVHNASINGRGAK